MPSGTPVQIRLDDTERDALDRSRRTKTNPPSRARAVRDLMIAKLQSIEADSSVSEENPRGGIAGFDRGQIGAVA
jgi:hypothetical protein